MFLSDFHDSSFKVKFSTIEKDMFLNLPYEKEQKDGISNSTPTPKIECYELGLESNETDFFFIDHVGKFD